MLAKRSMRSCIVAICFLLKAVSFGNDNFSFPEPSKDQLENPLSLWATYYYLPVIKEDSLGEIPLRDLKGNELGPKLNLKEWCTSAMEGSVQIIDQLNVSRTYNYSGVSELNPVDCSSFFALNLSKTKFKIACGIYGDGAHGNQLLPYRSLAVDELKIPYQTVLFIPRAKGAKIKLSDGTEIIHDGYFYAADRGGSVKNNHIDVFIGTSKSASFFPWIKSSESEIVEAFVVVDKNILTALQELHSAK